MGKASFGVAAWVGAVMGVLVLGTTGAYAQQPAKETAEPHVAAGSKAARAKDWVTAADEYGRAIALTPTAVSYYGLASALDQLGRLPEAFAAYGSAIYASPGLPPGQRAAAQKRVTEIALQTGTIRITFTEPDVHVEVDGVSFDGVPAPYRLMPGSRRITAHKDGFLPAERTVLCEAGQETQLPIALAPEAQTGTLLVHDHLGQALTVFVDGQPVGPAPQTVQVPPGPHEVYERNETRRAPPKTVTVEKGKTLDVELEWVPIVGKVDLRGDDPHVLIAVDGRLVGAGSFAGGQPLGTHQVTFSRESYVSQTQTIEVTESGVATTSMHLLPEPTAAVVPGPKDRSGETRGTIGSFEAMLVTQVGSRGSTLDAHCHDIATACTSGSAAGGGVLWSGGYMWGPLGFDVVMATGFDVAGGSATATDGTSTSYKLDRLTALGAVRARGAYESASWRVAGAAGVGLAEHVMALVPGGVIDYVAVGFTGDLTGAWRLSRNVALALGALLWIDNAGQSTGVQVNQAPFLLASGTQVLLLPHLGLEFGAF